jgi:hypothetical protein
LPTGATTVSIAGNHCGGSGDFFWLEHALKYQGEGRIKIKELWVPAGAILEDGCEDSARIIRQEARYRLKMGSGIRRADIPRNRYAIACSAVNKMRF